jgi:DNA polymerase I-like protein with 3'-5' exonuclease and polymerase domains
VGFCHDEIITEVLERDINTLVEKQEKIMIDSMKEVVPDFKVGVESNVCNHYTK